MADFVWRIPIMRVHEALSLLRDAVAASRRGDRLQVQELSERIRSIPGFPLGADPARDRIVIDPKGAKVMIEKRPTIH